jgi:hypothetical protein
MHCVAATWSSRVKLKAHNPTNRRDVCYFCYFRNSTCQPRLRPFKGQEDQIGVLYARRRPPWGKMIDCSPKSLAQSSLLLSSSLCMYSPAIDYIGSSRANCCIRDSILVTSTTPPSPCLRRWQWASPLPHFFYPLLECHFLDFLTAFTTFGSLNKRKQVTTAGSGPRKITALPIIFIDLQQQPKPVPT